MPAKVAGTWTMANGTMTLTQEYQDVQGTITVDGQTLHDSRHGGRAAPRSAFIAGGLTYTGKVNGNQIDGTITTPAGDLPWRCETQE